MTMVTMTRMVTDEDAGWRRTGTLGSALTVALTVWLVLIASVSVLLGRTILEMDRRSRLGLSKAGRRTPAIS